MQVTCPCGAAFEAQRSTAKFCSPRCRQRSKRSPAAGTSSGSSKSPSAFEKVTLRELKKLGKLDTMLGQQVLIIARRMANGGETGSAIASLSRDHSRLMALLGSGEDPDLTDPVSAAEDEIARKRAERNG